MAHRALTLKYRPQVFADLVGQEHISSVLGRAVESGRIAHAYLFTGARGVGKTTSARILAKALNCERRAGGKAKGGEPCNACTSCQEVASGVSLDVIEIDGASNRGIADVQALREHVRFAPTGGRHRVVIIDEVHQLSGDAFAALLKTLEEPPAHLVFIFATTDPQKLPETIRSRTQRFDFARVALRKVADRLLEIRAREAKDPEGVRFTLTDGAALLIAHKGEGSLRDAVSALDQAVSAGEADIDEALVRRVLGIPDRESFFAMADAITAHDPRATLTALHAAFGRGLDPRDLAEGLAEHFREVLVLRIDPDGGADLIAATGEDVGRLKAQGAAWSEHDLLRLVRIATEVVWPMRDSSQPLVHLEAAVLQMATLEPAESLATLLERLDALERRLGGAPGAAPPAAPASGGGAGGARSGGAGRGGASAAPVRAAAPPAPTVAPRRAPMAAPPPSPPGPVASTSPEWSPATSTVVAEPVAAPDIAGDIEQRWRRALAGVNGHKRMLGAFLEESRFMGLHGDEIVLAMDDLHRAVVDVAEHRALVNQALGEAFGRSVALRCVPLAAEAQPRVPSVDDVRPIIQRAIEVFDGEVIERRERGDRNT